MMASAGGLVSLAELNVGTDDNLQAARDTLPRQADSFVHAGVTSALSEALAPGLSLRLLTQLDGRMYRQTDGLNELVAALDGQLRLRPGNRFRTPTLGASMGIGFHRFQSQLRDANSARMRLFWEQPLTTRLAARGSLFKQWHGSRGRAFDATTRGGELALDWQASTPLLLTLAYQYRDGAVASVGMPGPATRAHAIALEADDVFIGQTAFSFDAQTHIGSLEARYQLSPTLSLQTQLRYLESDADFGSQYHRWGTLSGLSLRF